MSVIASLGKGIDHRRDIGQFFVAIIKKTDELMDVKKLEPSYIAGGNVKW